MRLNLTKREYIQLHEWHLKMRKYIVSKFDKIVIFHSSEKGNFDINRLILYSYYSQGYKFISCYPKRTQKILGFGQFIWPEHNYEIGATVETDIDGNYQVDINPRVCENECEN